MNILGIDTSSLYGSVAVVCDKKVIKSTESIDTTSHSKKLLSMVDSIIKQSSLTLADINGISVVTGPGSFTGIRIGISTSYGLSLSTNKKVVGISALHIIAHSFSFVNGLLCPIIDAKRGEVYATFFKKKGGVLHCLSDEMVLPLVKIFDFIDEPVTFIGMDANKFKDILKEKGEILTSPPKRYETYNFAAYAALLGIDRIKNTDSSTVNSVSPNYIRRSDAEINWEKKRSSLCH